MTNWIEDELYGKIEKVMPILCVDLLVYQEPHIYTLLCLRNNEPEKDRWWFPGGRVHKGETLIEAVRRIAEEELGLLTLDERQIFTFDYISKEGKHTPAVLYRVPFPTDQEVKLDNQHSKYQWVPLTQACDAVSYLGTWGWAVIMQRWN